MKIQSLVIVIFLFLSFTKSNAQSHELGNVTIAELQEKSNPKDTTAPATILFKKGKSFFTYDSKNGFTVNHVYEFKIKIYKKEGIKYADQKMGFYTGFENRPNDRLAFSDAVTYNLENDSIIETKLNSQGNFREKINKYWIEAIIILPNVKVGSIIEFKCFLKTQNIGRFPDFEMQYGIPLSYFEYHTEIPEFFIYKPILVGNLPIESESKFVDGNQEYKNRDNETKKLSFIQINTDYKGTDVPALANELYVDNIDNYKGAIKHDLERTRYPDQPVKDYAITWEGVANTIFKNNCFGKELNKKSFFANDVKPLITNVESLNERLEIIFKFVQNKMNWNQERGYYVDKGVLKAYASKTGNVAEINFILINMLKAGGIEANPVLVSTIENGAAVYPTVTGFNYVIAAAEIDGKQILLDASNKFTIPNILPLNTLNWKGRLIKKDGTSQEINLVPTIASKEITNMIAKINANGSIDGKVRIQSTDYNAYRYRVENTGRNEEEYLEKLENKYGKIAIADYVIQTNLLDPVLETFSFTADNQFDRIGDKMFINPMLFFTVNKNPFSQEKRQMPVYLGYPEQETYNVFFDIPNGYMVESMPKPMRIVTENKDAFYSMNITNEQNKIHIQVVKGVNKSIFNVDDYSMLKEFYQKIIVSQNEKIVLKRI
jgi:hypothetical protein